MKGLLKMKNVIKTFVITLISILATIIVCNINTTSTAHAETYDIEQAYDLVNKEMELYASCYDENDGTFNVDYDTACEITQLEAEYYATSAIEEQTTTTTTIATTIKEETTTTIEEQTTPTTTEIKEEQTTPTTTEIKEKQTAITEQQHCIECNQCRDEANDYTNRTAEIYAKNYDGTNFNIDYDTACELVEIEMEYYSTSHEQHEQTTATEEKTISETNLNNAYDYVNQITEIYASCYDGYDFNIDYDIACDIVQLEMEYYSK